MLFGQLDWLDGFNRLGMIWVHWVFSPGANKKV